MFEDDEIVSADPAYWIPSNYRDEPVHMAITADGSPVVPPASWFNNPSLTRPTALVIEQDGRVYGHIACWETKHIGMPGAIRPPRSKSNYAFFATGAVHTQEGHMVDVGQITLVGGHAPIDVDVPKAVAHYDDTQSAVCDVAIGEDRHGIWVAGALRPDVDDKQVRQLRASAVSGDWRPINGNLELVAVCSVNVPGFPIPRARVASGQTLALVAAGIELLVEDRLREYGDGTQHEIDEVLMAIATRVERLEAWMLAVVDPENMSSLEDDDKYGHGEYDDEHEHGEGCGCGMMSGGYGMKKKRGAMVSSKDIKMNADSIEKSTSIEDLRKRVRGPLMASLRSRVHGGNESVPFDRAAELRNRVHASTGVTAAVGKFDASLHPRGKDGKFIEKLGFVNFSVGRKQQRGQVVGIGKGTGNNKGKTVLTIQKEDGSTVDMTSDKVSQAAKSKADLSSNTGTPNQVVANKPDDIYAEVQRLTDTPIEDWEREDRVSAAFARDVLQAREKELNYSINAPENADYRDSLKEEFDSIRETDVALLSKEMDYDKANGSSGELSSLVDEDLAKTNAYKNIAKVRELSSAAKPYLDKPVEDWTPQEREDAWDTANAIGDVVFNPGSEEDVLPSGISESAIEISQTLLNKSVKYDQDNGKTPWYEETPTLLNKSVESGMPTGVPKIESDDTITLNGKKIGRIEITPGTGNALTDKMVVFDENDKPLKPTYGLMRVGPFADEPFAERVSPALDKALRAHQVKSPGAPQLDAKGNVTYNGDKIGTIRFNKRAGLYQALDNNRQFLGDGLTEDEAMEAHAEAVDRKSKLDPNRQDKYTKARAEAAKNDGFSKQSEIDEIWSREVGDTYGRTLSPEDQDRLIELLEEKQAETGLGGSSDSTDLGQLKKRQSERGGAPSSSSSSSNNSGNSGNSGNSFSDDEISDLRDLQDDISEDADVSPQIIEIVADMEGLAVGESDDPADFREMADTLQQYADEIDVESLDTGMLDLAPVLRWWSDRFSEAAGGSEDNSAPDVDTPAGDGMKNTPSEARAFAAEQDKKRFSKQDEINAIFSKEKTDSFGRDLSPEDQDRLIELLEEKQAETGLAGLSDSTDLEMLKKWQSERGNTGLKTIGDVEMFDLDEETYRDEDFLAAGSQLYSLPEDEWTPELYDWASQILDLIGSALDDTSEEDDEYEVYETVYGDLSRKLDVVNDKLGGITSSAAPSAYVGYLRQRVHQN